MKLDVKGGFPVALAVSILAHAFIFRAVHVRAPEALTWGEVVEVELAYAEPAPAAAPLAAPHLKEQPLDLRSAAQKPALPAVDREIPLSPADEPPAVRTTAAGPPKQEARDAVDENAGAPETGEDELFSLSSAAFHDENNVPPDDSGGAQAKEPAVAQRQRIDGSFVGQSRTRMRAAPLEAQSVAARINEELSRRIDRWKVYPPAARKRRIEGTVVCELDVDPAGNLDGVRVVGSSGSAILDDAAVALLTGIFPIKNPAEAPLVLVKAIRYSLVD
jgi:periplasmic protein TonB